MTTKKELNERIDATRRLLAARIVTLEELVAAQEARLEPVAENFERMQERRRQWEERRRTYPRPEPPYVKLRRRVEELERAVGGGLRRPSLDRRMCDAEERIEDLQAEFLPDGKVPARTAIVRRLEELERDKFHRDRAAQIRAEDRAFLKATAFKVAKGALAIAVVFGLAIGIPLALGALCG